MISKERRNEIKIGGRLQPLRAQLLADRSSVQMYTRHFKKVMTPILYQLWRTPADSMVLRVRSNIISLFRSLEVCPEIYLVTTSRMQADPCSKQPRRIGMAISSRMQVYTRSNLVGPSVLQVPPKLRIILCARLTSRYWWPTRMIA